MDRRIDALPALVLECSKPEASILRWLARIYIRSLPNILFIGIWKKQRIA